MQAEAPSIDCTVVIGPMFPREGNAVVGLTGLPGCEREDTPSCAKAKTV